MSDASICSLLFFFLLVATGKYPWVFSFPFCIMGPTELTTSACCVDKIRQITWHAAGTQNFYWFVSFWIKEMRQVGTGRVALWYSVWGQGNFGNIEVKYVPSNYQKYFTKMPYLDLTWALIYCSKTCDFRTFSRTWRSLDYNEYFPVSHLLFTKKGNGKYQAYFRD